MAIGNSPPTGAGMSRAELLAQARLLWHAADALRTEVAAKPPSASAQTAKLGKQIEALKEQLAALEARATKAENERAAAWATLDELTNTVPAQT